MAHFNLKDYVEVKDRIAKFWTDYPDGRINTEVVFWEGDVVGIKASAYKGTSDRPDATGHAYEVKGEGHVNKTSHVENCETSAVGRALAIMGYEISKSIASREEMEKVERMSGTPEPQAQPAVDLKRKAKDLGEKLDWGDDEKRDFMLKVVGKATPSKPAEWQTLVDALEQAVERAGE